MSRTLEKHFFAGDFSKGPETELHHCEVSNLRDDVDAVLKKHHKWDGSCIGLIGLWTSADNLRVHGRNLLNTVYVFHCEAVPGRWVPCLFGGRFSCPPQCCGTPSPGHGVYQCWYIRIPTPPPPPGVYALYWRGGGAGQLQLGSLLTRLDFLQGAACSFTTHKDTRYK